MINKKYLGKYCSLENIRFLHDVIASNKLYFSDPGEFNDPFEINPAMFKRKIFKPVRKATKKISPEVIDKIYREIWMKQQALLRNWGVCCFTEVIDDVLMWSHYANNHKGVCLIFDTTYKFFSGIKKVNYIQKRLQLPVFSKKEPLKMVEIMVSKHELWSYEKEWRLFRRFRNRKYRYPKSALKAIIFGCRCVSEDRDLIFKLTQNLKLEYYDAKMSPYDYKIDLHEIQP